MTTQIRYYVADDDGARSLSESQLAVYVARATAPYRVVQYETDGVVVAGLWPAAPTASDVEQQAPDDHEVVDPVPFRRTPSVQPTS